ncbi:von Willebrand factor A domain-containing protein 5A-like isoform X2 [Pteropus vampyrus]|uniref:von Willebrand factor A domain-containing protein 5A-like isoform X2 n=1 Tax=Pteropus vampyrus TaxID=132908 RepID=A0A6P6C2G7_PTEVA|nr:von Willebrand factor A domain-containing protein 5A-like isoform X2 [Pteropus vampyrus]
MGRPIMNTGLDKHQALGGGPKKKCMSLRDLSRDGKGSFFHQQDRLENSPYRGNLFEKCQAEGEICPLPIFGSISPALQADGSWDLNEGLAMVLHMSLEEILTAHLTKNADSSGWATVLEMLWLHANGKDMKCEWELLERKTVA